MKCIICNSNMKYYFSKEYTEKPFNDIMEKVGKVDYYKCENCGFVISKTHSKLEKSLWEELNKIFHDFLEKIDNRYVNQPPYIDQALMLKILSLNNIIDTEVMIDYAAGYGTLSKLLKKYFNIELIIYDEYLEDKLSNNHMLKHELNKYKTVINSAMFEHILNRDDLENLNNLVDSDGCLIIHSLICEDVPKDSNWFYLKPPVHTAFHTNKSMELLMKQWKYESSIYCPKSKSWVLFKKEPHYLKKVVKQVNEEFQTDYFYYKKGFMDYWKGF